MLCRWAAEADDDDVASPPAAPGVRLLLLLEGALPAAPARAGSLALLSVSMGGGLSQPPASTPAQIRWEWPAAESLGVSSLEVSSLDDPSSHSPPLPLPQRRHKTQRVWGSMPRATSRCHADSSRESYR